VLGPHSVRRRRRPGALVERLEALGEGVELVGVQVAVAVQGLHRVLWPSWRCNALIEAPSRINRRWKTRFANAHVDLGLARAARGRIDGVAEAGQRALAVFDAPPTATLWRAADLHAALSPYGDVAEVRDWRERYVLACQRLQHR
jgi:hypothetical protein